MNTIETMTMVEIKQMKIEVNNQFCVDILNINKRLHILKKLEKTDPKWNLEISSLNERKSILKEQQIDLNEYNKSVKCYLNGLFADSCKILKKLCKKYSNFELNDFLVDVYASYEVACSVLNIKNEYIHKLHEIMTLKLDDAKRKHVSKIYFIYFLEHLDYLSAKKYIHSYQVVNVEQLNICPENMCFFKENDRGKSLLIYTSGGIGDKIMYARFLQKLCEDYKDNTIILVITDSLYWIFNQVFKYENLKIIKDSQRNTLGHFDYHINFFTLPFFLDLNYNEIYPNYYLKNFLNQSNISLDTNKKNIIINWHGNYENKQEKFNRGMDIEYIVPLLKLKGINWITVQKEISKEELSILRKYNVNILNLDNGPDCFKETIALLKKVDLVVSTDTSLVHIAGTMDINCYVMLSLGCDWRWTRNDPTTKWYPNLKLFRQKKSRNWSNVIDELINELK
uniref:Glycosyltransferase n=1 Tax=viral metagenome TaxID=1070528 RepID=A0A6C0I8N4_9ZZZZ